MTFTPKDCTCEGKDKSRLCANYAKIHNTDPDKCIYCGHIKECHTKLPKILADLYLLYEEACGNRSPSDTKDLEQAFDNVESEILKGLEGNDI